MNISKGKFWLGIAVAFTLGLGILYVFVQQSLRLGANSPQSGMAGDAAFALDSGQKPSDLVQGKFDLGGNTPFIIIYDKEGRVVAGNGYLGGEVPQVPIGVLKATDNGSDNKVTWQAAPLIRIAAVVVPANDYYVLGGRSLFSTEDRIDAFGRLALISWALTMVSIYMVYLTTNIKPAKKSKK